MRRMIIEPVGWPCTLAECPSGFFVCDNGDTVNPSPPNVCFVTEYKKEDGRPEAYNSGGEMFCCKDSKQLMVQPVEAKWEEYEE